MDGRGRLAQPLNRTGKSREKSSSAVAASTTGRIARRASSRGSRFAARVPWLGKIERYVARKRHIIAKLRINRGGGVAASALIVLAAVSYGVVTGGHIDPVTNTIQDVRDGIGRAFGFRV